ncbi:MAG TPA: DNA mismatch repair protein MutS, partial [Haliangiales bacterium]|nr:DNA mismatch repair protein MutS [Haliangiales bacterium]
MRRPPAETPLMRQYLDVKERYPDGIVFFRLGDFYEMFFEDAHAAAQALDLTLTTRDKGKEDAIPMCGVPHHSARTYIQKLCERGFKVVICEQVEDPRLAKGIVRREVVRVVTPGVVLDEDMLDAKTARYLAAVVPEGARRGLAYLDVTTGDFRATTLESAAALADELARVEPREILAPPALHGELRRDGAALTAIEPPELDEARAILGDLAAPSAEGLPVRAAAQAVAYARATQPAGVLPLVRLVLYRQGETLVLDDTSKTNLELTETIAGRQKRGSLFGVLDRTETGPGARLLRQWLLFPATDVARIRRRQDAVERLVEESRLRADLRAALAGLYDLERLAGRVTLGAANPRDLGYLRRSLEALPGLAALLGDGLGRGLAPPELLARDPGLDETSAAAADIAAALVDEPPLSSREGGLVRKGYSAEVDELRRLADGGKDEILAIEARERERTGIASLKVRFNRVFGYYLEITRANLRAVPADYIRKQTLANAERFITPELADLEAKVLHAEDRLLALEADIFEALRRRTAERAPAILRAAAWAALLDACAALAETAHRSSWVRPLVTDNDVIEIEDGRHPVVAELSPAGTFVPNDCRLDPRGDQIVVVTGPNMAGKSTYMRQVAHITILAQMGSFVPARRASIGVVDRVFTRVGAADNLAGGESTFMVEMRETAHILQHATRRSLILLDEIGRGTSTYDGLSIAWAVAEYLHDAVGAKTLFATHYHELCALAAKRPRVKNVSVAVSERRGEIVFLRKIVPGGASRSYGIEVARLAGLPRSVVARSRQMLAELESGDDLPLFRRAEPPPSPQATTGVEEKLLALDPDRMTPMEALGALAQLRRLI